MQLAGRTWVPDNDAYFAPIFETCDVFERANLECGLSFVKEWDTAIDGGAHVGSWSRLLADKFRHVYAFEPIVANYSCLLRNLDEAGKRNVEAFRLALGDCYKTVSFEPGTNSGCWHIAEDCDAVSSQLALDEFKPLQKHRIGYFKLDVEGYEYMALSGAKWLLNRDHPVVQIEEKKLAHSYSSPSARSFLEGMGYKEAARAGRDVIFTWA